MGCDIHLLIEYDVASVRKQWGSARSSERRVVVPFSDGADILSLTRASVEIARDYRLFAALAGVARRARSIDSTTRASVALLWSNFR